MKAIAICGSPRLGGNTEYMLRVVLETLENHEIATEFISLRDAKLLPCRGCYRCLEEKRCIQQDDFEALYEKMLDADGIIIGSPVYVGRPTSLLSALLERATFSGRAAGRMLSGKIGAPVAVSRRAGHATAFSELLLWYFINDMVIPGSIYWNVGLAGARGAKDAANDLEGIEIMKHFGRNMARVMKALPAYDATTVDQNTLFFKPAEKDR